MTNFRIAFRLLVPHTEHARESRTAQLENFREAFDSFDADGGGSIDSSELRNLLQSLGQNPTDAELAHLIKMADTDGSGDIECVQPPRA